MTLRRHGRRREPAAGQADLGLPVMAPSSPSTDAGLAPAKLPKPLPTKAQPVSAQPVAFAPSALAIISDPHSQAAIRSMWAPEQWARPTDGYPYYNDDQHASVQVYLAPRGAAIGATPEAIAEAGRALLELDDQKVSAFLICMGKWLADTGGEGPHIMPTRIHVQDVLSFRGIKKHANGGYRPEQKEQARADILLLNSIWVRSEQDIWERTPRGQSRQKRVQVDSRLLEVAIESERDLWGDETPYAFRVRPGDWAQHYLGDGNRWIARLLRPIMRYHPFNDRLAMRLGIYLSFQWRIRARGGNYEQPWHMASLLEGAKIALPTHHPDRFRRDVERALARLQADGALGAYECLDPLVGDTAPRAWWRAWLDSRWRLLPPEEIRGQYAAVARPTAPPLGGQAASPEPRR